MCPAKTLPSTTCRSSIKRFCRIRTVQSLAMRSGESCRARFSDGTSGVILFWNGETTTGSTNLARSLLRKRYRGLFVANLHRYRILRPGAIEWFWHLEERTMSLPTSLAEPGRVDEPRAVADYSDVLSRV